MPNFVILVSECGIAIDARGSRVMLSAVVDGHRREWKLLRQDVVYSLAFRHDVLVKTRHHVGTAINSGRCLVLG